MEMGVVASVNNATAASGSKTFSIAEYSLKKSLRAGEVFDRRLIDADECAGVFLVASSLPLVVPLLLILCLWCCCFYRPRRERRDKIAPRLNMAARSFEVMGPAGASTLASPTVLIDCFVDDFEPSSQLPPYEEETPPPVYRAVDVNGSGTSVE